MKAFNDFQFAMTTTTTTITSNYREVFISELQERKGLSSG